MTDNNSTLCANSGYNLGICKGYSRAIFVKKKKALDSDKIYLF